MDNYCEHLIKIKKDSKSVLLIIFVWVSMIGISAVSFLILKNLMFAVILTGAAIYGGVYLTKLLNVEYEYIVTNGEIDIDLITGKANRKRLITFAAKDIDCIEKYKKGLHMFEKGEYNKKSVYCNSNEENIYCITFKHKNIGKVCLLMQITPKLQESILPYLDTLLAREAFK